MDTVNIFFKVRREDLVYINGLVETYDDLAVLRTVDPPTGLAVLMVSPGFEATARGLLASLAEEMPLEYVTTPEPAFLARLYESA